MSAIFDKTVNVLSASMDMYLLRHSIINDNIANAETPGYKSRRVDFESELRRQIAENNDGVTEKLKLGEMRPKVFEDPLAQVGLDRNSVDMEREMAQLSKNEIKYNATTQAISKKFTLLKAAIGGGQ